MKSTCTRYAARTRLVASPLLAVILTLTFGCLNRSVGGGSPETQPEDTESGYTREYRPQEGGRESSQVQKITYAEAKEIALQTVPGEVTAVGIERKLGKQTLVVEVFTDDLSEVDVIIDMETGKVLGTER